MVDFFLPTNSPFKYLDILYIHFDATHIALIDRDIQSRHLITIDSFNEVRYNTIRALYCRVYTI